jgi:hypothetical protein
VGNEFLPIIWSHARQGMRDIAVLELCRPYAFSIHLVGAGRRAAWAVNPREKLARRDFSPLHSYCPKLSEIKVDLLHSGKSKSRLTTAAPCLTAISSLYTQIVAMTPFQPL